MNTMVIKVLKDLLINKTKTCLILLTLFFGTMSVGIITMFSTYFVPEVNEAYRSASPYDVKLKTDPFDGQIIKEIAQIPGVKNAEARSTVMARFLVNNKSFNANLVAIGTENTVNVLRKHDGSSSLPPLGKNEIYLERATIPDIGKKQGEQIRILTKDNQIHEFVIREIVFDAVTEPYMLEGDIIAFINVDTLKALIGDSRLNEVLITIEGGGSTKEYNTQVGTDVAEFMESRGIKAHEMEVPNPGEFYATQALDAVSLVMTLLGSLSILLGVFLIFNIINNIMLIHIRQIGIMKAIGGKTPQILTMYLLMFLIIGLITYVIAMPLSAFAGYKLCQFLAYMFNMDLSSFRIPQELIILLFICTVIIPLAATLPTILKGVRTTAYKALNNHVKGACFSDIRLLNRFLKSIKYVSPMVLVSLRNIFRNKVRFILTLVTLALSGAVFITGLNLQKGFENSLQDAVIIIPDVILSLSGYENAKTLEETAQTVEGVNRAEAWAFTSARYIEAGTGRSKKVRIMGPKPGSELLSKEMCESKLLEGRTIENDSKNEILISNHLTDFYPNIEVGDEIELKIGESIYEFEVVGVIGFFGRPSDPLLIAGYRYMNGILGGEDMVNDLRLSVTQNTENYQADVAARLEDALKQKGINVTEVNLGQAVFEQFYTSSGITVALLMFLSVMIIIVGTVGLSGTLSLNLLERSRDIGIMRSIGGQNKILNKMVIIEGVALTIIASIFGIILSLPLTAVCNAMLGEALFANPLEFQFNFAGLVAWLVLSIAAAGIACILPCRKMNTMVTREVLIYE